MPVEFIIDPRSSDRGRKLAKEKSEMLKRIAGATVGIERYVHGYRKPAMVSGVHIGDGRILTVGHLFDDLETDEMNVVYNDNSWEASVEKTAPGLDLAIVNINDYQGGLELIDVPDIEIDYRFKELEQLLCSTYIPQKVITLMFYLGKAPDFLNNIDIEYLMEYQKLVEYIILMAGFHEFVAGNCGSGVFTSDGRLVGLVNAVKPVETIAENLSEFPDEIKLATFATAVSISALRELNNQ